MTRLDQEWHFEPMSKRDIVLGRLVRLLHFLGSLTTWRIALTAISAVTTLLGMMLLYNVFGSGHSGSLGFLKFIIPLGLAGALHAAIYWALGRWAALWRFKYTLFTSRPENSLAR